jgi:hypothetical protein
VHANLLRVLDTGGVLVKDLPVRGGVSKEATAMALGIVTKAGLAVVGTAPGGGRFKAARLTDRGQEAQWAFTDVMGQLDTRARAAVRSGRRSRAAGGPGAADRDADDPAHSP